MSMLRDTKVEVKVCIGIQDVTIWKGTPSDEPIIVAARISASEITLFVGPEHEAEDAAQAAPDKAGEEGEEP